MFRIVNTIALIVFRIHKLAPYTHASYHSHGEFDGLGEGQYIHVDVLAKGRNVCLSIWDGNVNLSIWGWSKAGYNKVMEALQIPTNGIVKLVSGRCGKYGLGDVSITISENGVDTKLDRAYLQIDTNEILASVHRCEQAAIYRQWGEPMSA